jgi:hypothetical protein
VRGTVTQNCGSLYSRAGEAASIAP